MWLVGSEAHGDWGAELKVVERSARENHRANPLFFFMGFWSWLFLPQSEIMEPFCLLQPFPPTPLGVALRTAGGFAFQAAGLSRVMGSGRVVQLLQGGGEDGSPWTTKGPEAQSREPGSCWPRGGWLGPRTAPALRTTVVSWGHTAQGRGRSRATDGCTGVRVHVCACVHCSVYFLRGDSGASPCCAPLCSQSLSHPMFCVLLATNPGGAWFYSPHFVGEETESQHETGRH